MKVLIGHNRYQWAGGEDAVVKTERQMLTHFGHEVEAFEADNEHLKAMDLFWSKDSYTRLSALLRRFKPDIAHFHNIYFALTPSVYDACRDQGVAVVQSLHNFRMLCANALLFRDGHVCEDCLTKSPWQGIKHRCYRDSYAASAAVTALTAYHRSRRTWVTKVDMYITATEFTRSKYIQAGLPPSKIMIKPNVYFPPEGRTMRTAEYGLYVGRLSPEKGVRSLLKAWEKIPHIPLKLMGDGPLKEELRLLVVSKGIKNIEFLGHADQKAYHEHMNKAKFLVVPSLCYENFPRIVVEAFAYGLPVLASRLGSLAEIIDDGRNGCLFNAADPNDLAAKAQMVWGMDTAEMSQQARSDFDLRFSPAVNHGQLMDIYNQARAQCSLQSS